tara:strand:- start:21976 stop:26007 length:4032 start_codon:yes stop_codon:yes gene_type:complete
MPNDTAPPGALPATLVTDDAVEFAGQLTSLLDGQLELDITQTGQNTQPTPPRGAYATLSVPAHLECSAALGSTRVRISDVASNRFSLQFAAEDSDIASRFRDAIAAAASRPEPEAAPKSPAAPTAPTSRAHTAPARPAGKAQAASAVYDGLLDEVRKQSLEHIGEALEPFLRDLTDYLLELSSKLRQRKDGENQHYASAIIVRHGRGEIVKRFVSQIEAYYDDLVPEEPDDQLWRHTNGGVDELDLVDLQDFEDYLLIDRMITYGEDLHRVPLEALTLRLAELVAEDPNSLRNPVHIRQLCRALQNAMTAVEIPKEVLPHAFDYFAKRFLRQLGEYYAPLNRLLANAGVLPEVEKEISNKGSLLKAKETFHPPARPRRDKPRDEHGHPGGGSGGPYAQYAAQRGPLDQVHQQLGEQLTGAMGRFTPASLYKSVVDALNFKREAQGLLSGQTLDSGASLSGTWDGNTVASTDVDQSRLADAQLIAQVLGELQRNATARDEVSDSESLRAYLAQHKDSLGALRNSSGLTADSLNQLDMVDNLFGTIRSQLDITSELKPALGALQIPLAKLALMDPRFFVDQGHTARTVVDKLSKLATSANFPNKALEGRINDIVDTIIADYESDSNVFDDALQKVERLAAQQERALSRNIERVVRTQEGQEKLSAARREVAQVIRKVIPEDKAPKVLIDLIECGWRDTMVLTHVKDGPHSASWRDQVKNLKLLCHWLDEQQAGDTDEDRNVERSLEAEPLLELIGAQISTALPTNISHEAVLEELRDVLAGNTPVDRVAVSDNIATPAADPARVREKIEDLPRLRRWVKRVEQLEKDNWLTYRDKSGKKKRMQLAWISPARDRFIFVNERGQKVADLSAVKLARELSRGVQPPAPADRLSVVDQSMYQTLEHVQKTLSFARNHDTLTRLINRETFLDQISRSLRHSRHKLAQHAVLYLNIDQFNLVNEVYDRISGDQVLLEFAKLLSQLHGKKSSSARIRADEFGILLLDRPIEAAMEFAEKIREDIAASSMDIDGESVRFTVSIGVVAIAEHSPSVEEVLEAARAAMQLAKQGGRNRVVQYKAEQDEAKQYKSKKRHTRQNLEEALATDRFVLRAQPIVQTAVQDSGHTTQHFELLLGLRNKDGTLDSPEEFIRSAERYGFMTLVDRWVVRESFSWISQLMDAQKVIPNLAINLSGASVTDDAFLDYLLEQISEFGVGTSRLCFEITETGTISNLVKAADFVRAFRNIGCKFSIDDFGTGLASHNYLRELPVDYVKIDGSFITGIHKNRNDYAMARSINDLAHFLGQQTIAESVENAEIIAKLEEIGVDYLQGWGIGKPKLLAEVSDDLSTVEK